MKHRIFIWRYPLAFGYIQVAINQLTFESIINPYYFLDDIVDKFYRTIARVTIKATKDKRLIIDIKYKIAQHIFLSLSLYNFDLDIINRHHLLSICVTWDGIKNLINEVS